MKHLLTILLLFTAYVQCDMAKIDMGGQEVNIALVGLEQGVEQTSIAFYPDGTAATWIRAEKSVIDRLSADPKYIILDVQEEVTEIPVEVTQ